MNNLQQTIIERYTEKKFNSKDFTYRDYINLRKKLIEKNTKADKKIAKTEKQIEKIESMPKTTWVSAKEYDDILTTSALATMLLAGAATHHLGGDLLDVSTAALVGVCAGAFVGFANVESYRQQPLTNAICRQIVKNKHKKVKKLNNKKELRNYTLYCFRQQENDSKPNYEEFVSSMNDNSEDFSM